MPGVGEQAGITGQEPDGRSSPKAGVPPNLADLPEQAFRIAVSADLDNLGGHRHRPYHYTSTHCCATTNTPTT
jgi:hypothetical protein